jgi:peptidoglycan/xylan/chitin deacetylase (PgdA/CDA1 family)
LSAYQTGLPIVESAGFKATFYVVTQQIGFSAFMTKDNVLDTLRRGNEIGAHTRSHPHLPTLSDADVKTEIEGSRQDLINMGVPVTTFAYPYGEYNSSVVNITKAAGFSGARATAEGFNDKSTDRYLLNTFVVEANTPISDVRNAIDQAGAQKKWLIIMFHQIDGTQTESVTHQTLQQIVDYVKSSGIPVVTNAQGLSIMQNISQ